MLLLRDGGAQPPCQLFVLFFFLGLQISICFFSHVVSYCFTRDIKGSCTTIRMPSTTSSRISEMAIVGQPQPLICCINFSGHLLMSRDYKKCWTVLLCISTYSFIWWNDICSSKIGPTHISRTQRHLVFVFQSWKMTLDHIESHSKFE